MPTLAMEPFRFVTSSFMVKIRPERARTLADLRRHIQDVPDASIFYHTFQSLELHHYTAFSNDFAQWAVAACNEAELAEQLASVDLRDFVSVEDLRKVFVEILDTEMAQRPDEFARPAYEPFYFCEAEELSIPVEFEAHTLEELANGIRQMSVHTLHYHFINSRLRLRLKTNDFSKWIEDDLGYNELADKLNHIDVYTNSLEKVRREILRMLNPWLNK
jgi:hypothetical protein